MKGDKMEKSKIDWTDSSWNPVTGCYHDCPYCYARNIAKRFGGGKLIKYGNRAVLTDPVKVDGKILPYPYGFIPTFHKYKMGEYAEKKGRNIFVCSMADLFGKWVPDDWIFEIFSACLVAMQHNYLFLTKNPGRYIELAKQGMLPHTDNFWYGSSVTGPHDLYAWFPKEYKWFLSVEPLHEDLGEMDPDAQKPEWIIVGAETGRRKDKVIPKKGWIEKIYSQCREYGIPLFMKSSLADIWAPLPLVQEFPERLEHDTIKDWIKCIDQLPEENVVVETKIDDGEQARNFARLYRNGKLWFLEDGSMYVYYEPTHWRYTQ